MKVTKSRGSFVMGERSVVSLLEEGEMLVMVI